MGRYFLKDIKPNISAGVSTHGYYKIFKTEDSDKWASIDLSVNLFSGSTSDIGITYDYKNDELIPEHDSYEFIKTKLLEFLQDKEIND